MRSGATSTTPARRALLVTVTVAASFLVACSSDGTSPLTSLDISVPLDSRPAVTAPPAPEEPAPEEPAPEEPAPDEPAPEEPAPEEPAPEEAAPEEPAPDEPASEEHASSDEWALLLMIGLVVLALVIGAVALASRRSRRRDQMRSSQQRQLDDVTTRVRSIHDSAVLSILQTSNPAMLQSSFFAARAQLIDLEARIESLAPEVAEENRRRALQELGLAVAGVRGALESNVGLRSDPDGPGQGELIEASNRTVLYRSEQLESALQSVLYLQL